MERNLPRLADETFDLCILGGGVNGLATARDAAQRGLRVALVERGDFGGETSAKSLKIIHGGLRYLQHLDFARMVESIRERTALMRIAPHLVEPLGFLVPTYPGLAKGRTALRVALAINDLVGWRRNQGLPDSGQHLPGGRILSRADVLRRVPELPSDALTGGALFYDARMRNSDRMTLSFALSAAEDGAVLANYCEGLRFDVAGGTIRALEVRDRETGACFPVRARLFAAMTGPWRDLVDTLLPDRPARSEVVKNAGLQIITRRQICPESGLALPSPHVDPAARLQRGARHYFSTPWRGHTIWGTTDRPYQGAPEDWRVREADVQAFLDELNTCLPGMDLRRDEVTLAFGGLRLTESNTPHHRSQVSRRYEIYDHRDDLGLSNLISMDGIKYTACRVMAEKAVDLVVGKLQVGAAPCRTAVAPLWGGDVNSFRELKREVTSHGFSPETAEVLAESYGSRWREPGGGELIPGTAVPRSVLVHAVTQECALHLDDLLLRRTPFGALAQPSEDVVEAACAVFRELRGWTAATEAEERKRFLGNFHYA